MRNLCDIIKQIFTYLDGNNVDYPESFKNTMRALESSTQYSAPEAMHLRWEELARIMTQFFPEDSPNYSALCEIVCGRADA